MRRQGFAGIAIVAGVLVLAGCEKPKPQPPKMEPPARPLVQSEQPEPEAKSARKRARRSEPQPTEKVELPKPPEATAIPKVTLSDEIQATNRVKVGDKLPGGEMADLSGKPQAIEKLLGTKATVVFFWTAESGYSTAEVEDLQADVFQPMAARGVQVVGISLDQDPKKVRPAAEKAGAKFPILLDKDKKYFAKLATDKPMRTYLVDAKGVVRWFDVEYSRSTERDLLAGLEFLLNSSP